MSITREMLAKLREAPVRIQQSFRGLSHVRETVQALPDLPENLSREDFIEQVRTAPVKTVANASFRQKYLDYLGRLGEDKWPVHLKSVRQLQDRAKHAELSVQGPEALPTPDRDGGVSDPETEPVGDERTGDG